MSTNQLLPLMASFVQVVQCGGFSAAARQQHVSPSALSRQVAQLEASLGVRLLERTTRRLRLSTAGTEVFERCRDMLSAAEAAIAVGEQQMGHPRGQVRLSVPKAFGKYRIAPLLAEFLARYPEVDVSLNLSDQSPDLIADGFDLLISITETPPAHLAGRPLCQVQQILCASPTYLAAHGTPQHPEDLLRHQCLYLDEHPADRCWHFSQGQQHAQVSVQGRLASNHSEVRLNGALQHLGIACLPHFTAAVALAEGALQPVLSDWRYSGAYQGSAWALYPSNRHVPPRLRVLIDFLAEKLAANAA